ncbi:MAG TPA: flagellar biosynthetic protein FliO, partial [Lachnospiraceae bacterium]|nr:flagellar biosynthetic protein FliO [Lachnospiraceae bacterium]
GESRLQSFAELLGLIVIFLIIVVLAYFASRLVGKTGLGLSNRNRNFTIIETLRLSQTKYLQIVKVTDKYFVIGVTKEHIEYLTEIDGDKLETQESISSNPSFKDILSKIKTKNTDNQKMLNEDKDDNKDA